MSVPATPDAAGPERAGDFILEVALHGGRQRFFYNSLEDAAAALAALEPLIGKANSFGLNRDEPISVKITDLISTAVVNLGSVQCARLIEGPAHSQLGESRRDLEALEAARDELAKERARASLRESAP